jgi:N-acyl-D-amino-acid deacylase
MEGNRMRGTILFISVCFCLIFMMSLGAKVEKQEYSLIIKNGYIIDGTGNPWFKADIGLRGGIIVKIGNLSSAVGEKIIDAQGLIVSPGFIDIHNHSDDGLLTNPKAENYVRQGVTTMFVGQCGKSMVPSSEWPSFKKYFSQLEERGMVKNVAALIGHGQIRRYVIGDDDRKPTPEELDKMKNIIAQAMEDGAYGLSTGLVYHPGMFADKEEIIELCKVVAKHDGIYATHVRDDAAGWEDSILESIETAEKSGVRLQISHNESHYPNWGKLDNIMMHIEDARARGLRVSCDVIPTLCGSQGIINVFPNWALAGGVKKLVERLKTPDELAKIRKYVLHEKEKHTSPASTLIADGHADKIWVEGENLAEIAKKRGLAPLDAAIDLVLTRKSNIGIIQEFHFEDDMCKLIQHPLSSICSDGQIVSFGQGMPHPRCYSCFPLVFRKYVRGETRKEEPREVGRKILSLPEAVRKITSCPAQRLRLRNRGLLRENICADIVLFDPQQIEDQATYNNPHQYPKGIPYVIVNGELVVEHGEYTGVLPGKVIRGPRYSK